jgi:hypothetical protein
MTNALEEFARHCSGENDPDNEVYEVDGGDLTTTLKNAVAVIEQLEGEGKEFEVSFEASDPNDGFGDDFEVVIFKVDKAA